jgi:hypothetical protein
MIVLIFVIVAFAQEVSGDAPEESTTEESGSKQNNTVKVKNAIADGSFHNVDPLAILVISTEHAGSDELADVLVMSSNSSFDLDFVNEELMAEFELSNGKNDTAWLYEAYHNELLEQMRGLIWNSRRSQLLMLEIPYNQGARRFGFELASLCKRLKIPVKTLSCTWQHAHSDRI